MKAAHRTADAYDALGLPETRQCYNPECPYPNPQPIKNFQIKTRTWSDGRIVKYPGSWCKRCLNKKKRDRREKLKAENPQAVRDQEKRHREKHIAKDPEAHREYQRFWSDEQRRANGVPQREFRYRNGTDSVLDKRLPLTDEFLEWVRTLPITQLEKILGTGQGTLLGYAHGKRVTITLGLADRIIMQANDGHLLTDFWPDA